MANEPPCAILNEKYEIVDYDYTRCDPICCSTLCPKCNSEDFYYKGIYFPTITFTVAENIYIPIEGQFKNLNKTVYVFKGEEFKKHG